MELVNLQTCSKCHHEAELESQKFRLCKECTPGNLYAHCEKCHASGLRENLTLLYTEGSITDSAASLVCADCSINPKYLRGGRCFVCGTHLRGLRRVYGAEIHIGDLEVSRRIAVCCSLSCRGKSQTRISSGIMKNNLNTGMIGSLDRASQV